MLRYAVWRSAASSPVARWRNRRRRKPGRRPPRRRPPGRAGKSRCRDGGAVARDHLDYEVRDEITGKISATRANVVTEVTPTEISMRFRGRGTPNQGLNVYDDLEFDNSGPGDTRRTTARESKALATGKTWTFQSNDVNTGVDTLEPIGPFKSRRQEKLTTRAGTFETSRSKYLFEAQRQRPDKKEEVTGQTWYAPAIRSLGQRGRYHSGRQHLVSQQYHRTYRIWS